MIFNSFEFIFLFLPIVFIVYFLFNKINFTISKVWLLFASLFFYGYWNPSYLPLILVSLVVNFIIGSLLSKRHVHSFRKTILTIGIIFNVCLLGYYKYYDFFVENVNTFFGTNLPILNLLLPLAISFYTFQQIAYLVDSYRRETEDYNFLNYGIFVTFFPQLIAGPIVHHSDVMPQFADRKNRKINYENISLGLFIFAIGLFKKVVLADTFAIWANKGYAMTESLTFLDSWATALAYTFQLYFDFSGYSDMAIGLALLFNIKLPINFNSPYKALDIQDFWRRWHITLSGFLTKYIYIPLGGNRKGSTRTYINIFLIFFISGIWHGAGWTFILWGTLHGLASIIARLWKKAGFKLNKWIAWFITFQFVNATWVFFRAPSISEALNVLKAMIGLNGVYLPKEIKVYLPNISSENFYQFPLEQSLVFIFSSLLIGMILAFLMRNSIELTKNMKPNWFNAIFTSALLLYCFTQLLNVSEFLYFNF
ncbi:D-alanyl-lipoteichoic acid acyltransferase DltB (MBOAT superfamily) [Bacillus oleivorans]|uniref:D-alanyl-lipoteichoic acid acyltransferase DltB (MBOAT superfamily) n=1 Tax=Bacillus oleivorans TaxID=1448271 RepID=A0A285CIK3_9BACI|nr:MBOAT family protein [Bacillus oleivorans]SNX67350.1 D-alanyl-lipoteichoic acid acyltransferase DltB (MBOAT superfamily) [Bacillus oleivorans]